MTSVSSGTRPFRTPRIRPSTGPRRPASGKTPAGFAGAPKATNRLPARSLRA
ncbi:hypothetical protein AB0F03_13330 [Streptomyces sp. NPDC028722]|uniref:hypothetical protein n=1 Tax=Streptomyces sp. NPDC028722 TaxID=3155016 RepID=UPI0033FF37C4